MYDFIKAVRSLVIIAATNANVGNVSNVDCDDDVEESDEEMEAIWTAVWTVSQ